jgi:proline dehydrogenase
MMSLLRGVFLKASESVWLREHLSQRGFLRRSMSRFMPGEHLEDALETAKRLSSNGIFSVLTHLGENVHDPSAADEVTRGYVDALQQIREAHMSAEISLKLTQLGLDLSAELCRSNLLRIVEASSTESTVWIDMEHSPYVDVTLDIYRDVHEKHRNTGVCLQAYLFRTEKDLQSLIPLGPRIRLVKGAYNEPPEISFAEKKDVDENYFSLAQILLGPSSRSVHTRAALATHDRRLVRRICEWAAGQGIAREQIEFQMLYGIQGVEQLRLARAGYRSEVLISYGSYWFPWFMRRLAERPANVLFVAQNIFTR